MRECISHHNACDCREAKYTMDMALLKAENTALQEVAHAAREFTKAMVFAEVDDQENSVKPPNSDSWDVFQEKESRSKLASESDDLEK